MCATNETGPNRSRSWGDAPASTECGRFSPARSSPWAGGSPGSLPSKTPPAFPSSDITPIVIPANGPVRRPALVRPLASSSVDDRPIGMFDSGFGGLSVARALIDLAPAEDLVYVGDTGRYPYGPRAMAEVRSFAVQIGRWLVAEHDVKLIVVACNTATAAGLEALRALVEVPVVGVIDPGMRALSKATRNRRAGVIGTVGTISSGAYQRAAGELQVTLELTCGACPGFVEFVERGEAQSDQLTVLAERLLAPVRAAGVDALLLGCTHYPFLARTIADVMGRDVVLVSSADETAFEVRAILAEQDLATSAGRPGSVQFFSSGDVEWFRTLGGTLFGSELSHVGEVSWPAVDADDGPGRAADDVGVEGSNSQGRRSDAAWG
jgi:glutamate racemase